MLRIMGVSVRRRERAVLDEVSLQCRAGELVVLEGARGAGKSTLLRVAATLERADSGEIWIAGRDVSVLQHGSLPYVRRNVGYCPPEPLLVPGMTALENVMLPPEARGDGRARARELALRALGRVGITGLATHAVDELSSAERRLCVLARALVGAPPLLLVDDPSAGLAPSDAGAALSALLAAVEAGAAAVCASADGAFVTAAVRAGARRVRLEGGRLLPGGGPIGVVGSRRAEAVLPAIRLEGGR